MGGTLLDILWSRKGILGFESFINRYNYKTDVRHWLKDMWIGRARPREWPATSLYLTPRHSFLWGYLKEQN